MSRRKLSLVAAWCLGSALLAGICSLFLNPVFVAEAVIIPVTTDPTAGTAFSGTGASLSALAPLAGLGFGAGSPRDEAVATLRSRMLVETFAKEGNLLPVLFSKQWDSETNTWKAKDPTDIPTIWDAGERFRRSIRTVTEDRRTGLVTLTVAWKDPKIAAEWANGLVARADAHLRQRAIEQATSRIDFVQAQLQQTSTVELRSALFRLYEAELKNVMLAKGSPFFALKVIDPAVPPRKRSLTKNILFVLGGGFLGLIVSSLVIFRTQVRP